MSILATARLNYAWAEYMRGRRVNPRGCSCLSAQVDGMRWGGLWWAGWGGIGWWTLDWGTAMSWTREPAGLWCSLSLNSLCMCIRVYVYVYICVCVCHVPHLRSSFSPQNRIQDNNAYFHDRCETLSLLKVLHYILLLLSFIHFFYTIFFLSQKSIMFFFI